MADQCLVRYLYLIAYIPFICYNIDIMSSHENGNYDWLYTKAARASLGDEYLMRPLIGRDDKIGGGVYYGTYSGEAIVIDPEKYPAQYERYYKKAVSRATSDGHVSRSRILASVYETVHSEMAYSQEGVDQILANFANKDGLADFPDGEKVELSAFMSKGVGVCRHQALACAILLERFKEEGYIRGDISVDRSSRWDPKDGKADGHAWVRYIANNGQIMILDVAQDYIGRIEDTDPAAHWNYMRPDEQRRSQEIMGKLGVETPEGLLG